MITDLEKYMVSQAMLLFGGSFVRKLGDALASADAINTAIIKGAFLEYWEKYLDKARQAWPDMAKELDDAVA